MNGLVEGIVAPLAPTQFDQGLALAVGQQIQSPDRRFGIFDDARQQRQKMISQALHAPRCEQVGAVLEPAAEPFPFHGQFQRQVHLRGPGFDLFEGQFQIAHSHLAQRIFLEAESGLIEGAVGQVPLDGEIFEQLFERHVLVGEAGQSGSLDRLQKRREILCFVDPGPNRQHVQKAPDQGFQFGAIAARDRSAHHHVILSAVAIKQNLESGHQRHEQGRAFPLCQFPDPLGQRRGNRDPDPPAPKILLRRAGIIRRQIEQRRSAAQPFPPKAALLAHRLSVELFALPGSVVRILDRQRRQSWLDPVGIRLVQCHELPKQHLGGPAVGDGVMHHQQPEHLVLAESNHQEAQQRSPRQVVGFATLLDHQGSRPVFSRFVGQGRQVDLLQRQGKMRGDLWRDDAIHLGKARA